MACRRELRRLPRDPSKWLVRIEGEQRGRKDIVLAPGERFEDKLASAVLDMLREMIKGFAQAIMDAEAEQPLWARRG